MKLHPLLRVVFLLLLCPAASAEPQSLVERGRYLATAADCVACHTAINGQPYAGGRPIETPFGVIYSRNLTPDVKTGIGDWSDADFYRALHKGLSRNGSHLYPAFPFTYFTQISQDDAVAMKAYLDTLEPVQSATPPNEFPWPLNQRWVMGWWKLLFFQEGPDTVVSPMNLPTDKVDATTPSRGAYLVEALAHCGACHTPKNLLGADQRSASFQGGTIEHWLAPNLTGDSRTGLGKWSSDEIVEYLQTGRNARALASGPMAEVVEVSTSKLHKGDLQAIADYLKALPAAGRDVKAMKSDPDVQKTGEVIFEDACTACHQSSGEALPRAFAPLKGNAVVQSENPISVIRVILKGSRAATTDARPTPFAMPAFDWKLNDAEVAAVASYIRTAWGNEAPAVSSQDVKKLRRELDPAASVAGPLEPDSR